MDDKQRRMAHKTKVGENPEYKQRAQTGKIKVLYSEEKESDQWDTLLDRSTLWRTFCVTAWTLRFVHNSLFKRCNTKKRSGPLTTEEINNARNQWIKKAVIGVKPTLKNPCWKLGTEESTGVLKYYGRISGYQPLYFEGAEFANKLISHAHKDKTPWCHEHHGNCKRRLLDITPVSKGEEGNK